MTQRVTNRGVVCGVAVGALVTLAGTCTKVMAQDSVAVAPGLPGDASIAYNVGASGDQINNFAVDMTTITTSWGNRYLIGPIAKASASTQTGFFNHLIGATAASSTFTALGTPFRTSYFAWNTAGQGTTNLRNATPTDPSGTGNYGLINVTGIPMITFGSAFMEFAGGPDGVFGNGDDENNIVTAMVSFPPRYPGRVYVSRIMTATNRPSNGLSNASLGLGGVDSSGNVTILGDGLNMTGANPILNKKMFRIDAATRLTTSANQLSEAGGTDSAATRIINSSNTTGITPTIIPEQLAGRPVLVGGNFLNQFVAETTANSSTTTSAHMPGGSARGTYSFHPATPTALPAAGSVGTMAALVRPTSSTKTRSIGLWSVSNTGAVLSTLRLDLPTANGSIVDIADGFSPSSVFGSLENQELTNYASQAAFRGANGPVAMTVLGNGDTLVAATVAATGQAATVPGSLNNYIIVGRIPAGSSTPTWFIAAHTGGATGSAGGQSKKIFGDGGNDGILNTSDPGEGDGIVDATPIGSLAIASEVFPGVTTGPSLSAPAFDAAGNIYFMSSVSINTPSQGASPASVKTQALLRANFDPINNTYSLEKLVGLDTVLAGLNSTRNYQVQFFSVADSDSIDSGTIWSNSTVQQALPGVNPSIQSFGSPLTLGSLIFRAKIVYDNNNDGQFIDPSIPGQSGTDEAYNTLMLLLPKRPIADIGSEGGSAGGDRNYDNNDFIVFIDAFFASDLLIADVGGAGGASQPDGILDNNDFIVFIDAFFNQN
jgi:hypothetical protein